jgi:hypothetical protein
MWNIFGKSLFSLDLFFYFFLEMMFDNLSHSIIIFLFITLHILLLTTKPKRRSDICICIYNFNKYYVVCLVDIVLQDCKKNDLFSIEFRFRKDKI